MNQSTAYLMQFIMRKIDNAVSVHFDYIHVEVPNYIYFLNVFKQFTLVVKKMSTFV